jgi:hypothetical protein
MRSATDAEASRGMQCPRSTVETDQRSLCKQFCVTYSAFPSLTRWARGRQQYAGSTINPALAPFIIGMQYTLRPPTLHAKYYEKGRYRRAEADLKL